MITIDGIPMDLAEKEDHKLESAITDHPVESGVNITDHIRPVPRELTLTGVVVSNTPIGAIAQDPSRQGKNDFAGNTFRFLEDLWAHPRTVTVVTGLKKYESMGLKLLQVPREAKNAGGLVFSATFKQVVVKNNRRATVLLPATAGEVNLGPQGITTVDGKHVLWRKGKPPGKPSRVFDNDEKPDGVIVGQEVATLKNGKVIHQDGKTALTDEEVDALRLDLKRDEKLRQDAARRAPKDERKAALKQVDRNRTDAAMRILKGQEQHAGAQPDPAVAGSPRK